jgi:hypothetical protein
MLKSLYDFNVRWNLDEFNIVTIFWRIADLTTTERMLVGLSGAFYSIGLLVFITFTFQQSVQHWKCTTTHPLRVTDTYFTDIYTRRTLGAHSAHTRLDCTKTLRRPQ